MFCSERGRISPFFKHETFQRTEQAGRAVAQADEEAIGLEGRRGQISLTHMAELYNRHGNASLDPGCSPMNFCCKVSLGVLFHLP